MDLINPILLAVACALGAVGVLLALPRKKGFSGFIVGAAVATIALAALFVGLGFRSGQAGSPASGGGLPNFHFYIFSAIALFGAIRVISHPRPVYSALFFILTILASCGLYLLLSAEFMAFALVIVYAGAILITYLFVIMLATEAPSNETLDMLGEYDRYSREPVFATVAGFVLLAGLASAFSTGAMTLPSEAAVRSSAVTRVIPPDPATDARTDANLAIMPVKVNRLLASATRTVEEERAVPDDSGGTRLERITAIKPLLAPGEQLARSDAGGWAMYPRADGAGYLVVEIPGEPGTRRQVPQSLWPADLRIDNTEGVAFALIGGKPGAIEIAGVILLMAMLGAVVLARKKVDLDEDARRALVERHLVEPRLAPGSSTGSATGAPRAPASVGGGA